MTVGRYRLEDLIATGGMGEVWRAVDTVLERPVAVKMLYAEGARQAETVARFRREARLAGSVCHPAIASVYDFGEAGPGHPPYLVMELVDGQSLAEVLRSGPLDAARTMDVIAQAAAGLQAAHLAGLVHQDVKPANLLLGRDGQVKVTDFGIAQVSGAAPAGVRGMIACTPAYLAPERAADGPATPAGDVYALGVVAYECLAGHPPFTGAPLEVVCANRDLPLPPLPGTVPAGVAGLVAELTAKDPAGRPSAGEAAAWADRLRGDLAGSSTGVPPSPAAGPGPTLAEIQLPGPADGRRGARRDRRRLASRALVPGAAVVVLGVLAGLLGILVSGPSGTPGPSPAQAAARTFEVDAGSLVGQPVPLALGQLRQLGFAVRVRWQPTSQQPAGTVVSISPGGQVRAGSVVTVTGALPPRQVTGAHARGGGNDGNNGDGRNGGDGNGDSHGGGHDGNGGSGT
ncbi:MAG TPA: serine/threonine protein kinase [Streptosporangiaceae bacterium]|nr:serine/threonine protein kinase [Streptosporangiaceae bacterium]